MAMAALPTSDILQELIAAVPVWTARLDELGAQIAQRQLELAQITGSGTGRQVVPSIRHRGSMESLLLKEGVDEHHMPPSKAGEGHCDDPKLGCHPSDLPACAHDQIPPSGDRSEDPAVTTQGPYTEKFHDSSKVVTPISTAKRGKRRPDSIATGLSRPHKYRTRSMIIVYYDSTVQSAFEEMVQSLSIHRNHLRKGRMAQKLKGLHQIADSASLRGGTSARKHESAVELNSGHIGALADQQEHRSPPATVLVSSARFPDGDIIIVQRHAVEAMSSRTIEQSQELHSDPLEAASQHSGEHLEDEDESIDISNLQFMSTRRMMPAFHSHANDNHVLRSQPLSLPVLRTYRRNGPERQVSDIFDDLDTGLEWCQSQCEHAAHQFLRDGHCNSEIEGIRTRLGAIAARATAEAKVIKQHDTLGETALQRQSIRPVASRVYSTVQMRASVQTVKPRNNATGSEAPIAIEAMEVDDDEGIEDMDMPPILVYKRTREF